MKKRTVVSIVLALVTCLLLSVTAMAASATISGLTRNKQEKSLWCWAACTETLVKKGASSVDNGGYNTMQQRIVSEVKGNLNNQTGNFIDIRDWLQGKSSNFSNMKNYVLYDTTTANKMEKSIITHGKPVLVTFATQKYPTTITKTAHMMIAYRADDSTHTFSAFDPWGKSNVFGDNSTYVNWAFTAAGVYTDGVTIGAFGGSKCYARQQATYF